MTGKQAAHWLDEHGDALYAFAFLHLPDPHRAEDAVQETLLAALQSGERYAGNASVRTWLIGILKHKIADDFRRQARETTTPHSATQAPDPSQDANEDDDFRSDGRWDHPLGNWGNPETAAANVEFWGLIERCLAAMSPRLSRLFVLRELWEWDTGRICKELSVTRSNLFTTLHRARLGMRRCLERSGLG
jgi:RNA polymerase sigma-70 factor (ECF subfamily)